MKKKRVLNYVVLYTPKSINSIQLKEISFLWDWRIATSNRRFPNSSETLDSYLGEKFQIKGLALFGVV